MVSRVFSAMPASHKSMLLTRARFLTLVFVCALPATMRAQTASDTLQVPVGILRVLDVPVETNRAFAMLRAIRLLYSSPRRDPIPQAIADFDRLIEALERIESENDGHSIGH